MSAVRFTVEKTRDIPGRGGILVSGRVTEGVVKGGMTLRNETTGYPVRILGVEFLTPARIRSNQTTLVVDRRDAALITPGVVLTAPE